MAPNSATGKADNFVCLRWLFGGIGGQLLLCALVTIEWYCWSFVLEGSGQLKLSQPTIRNGTLP